jgi:hypothetical protein
MTEYLSILIQVNGAMTPEAEPLGVTLKLKQ